ncbi:MAG: cytochrome c biogenesis CcdA family protein [Verrucomicrobiia bacterium]
MESIFKTLSNAVESQPHIAIAAALLWGILSILLSPCHLASIPLIVGFISKQGKIRIKDAFITSLCFASGILITIAIIGFVTAATGKIMGDVGKWGNYIAAVIFLLVGLNLMEVIPLPISPPSNANLKSKGFFGAFILGLVFGIALGPCTFAFMAPMLAVVFKLGNTNIIYAASLLLAYGIGHCGIITIAGTFTEWIEILLKANEKTKVLNYLKFACGVLVIAGGVWLIYTAR